MLRSDPTYQNLIERKKFGSPLDKDQIFAFAQAVTQNRWPDYQIAALLMAMRLKGLNDDETLWLTQAMAYYSAQLNLQGVSGFVVDKHSTGGVGDGTSLVLAPLAASLGLLVPMMSGRSLELTGGTLDKLDAIPGFRHRLSPKEIATQVKNIGIAMFGQTQKIAPVDRRLYALRDAIGAVDCRWLIVPSILSKKLTEDLDGLVFDVKMGRAAFFKNYKEAKEAAKQLVWIAKKSSLKARALLTDMEEPLGERIGNSLEVSQALDILENRALEGVEDFMEVTTSLLVEMMFLAKKAYTQDEARKAIRLSLERGFALKKFEEMLVAQGVKEVVAKNLRRYLPRAKRIIEIKSPKSGWVRFVDARLVAQATQHLGALRLTQEDEVDLSAGVVLHKKTGDPVQKGEILGELHASRASNEDCKMAVEVFKEAFSFSRDKTRPRKRILEVIR